jgi:endonuclease III
MSESATPRTPSAGGLVGLLGGHPLAGLAIEPADGDAELLRWWVAALLLSSRRDAARAEAAFGALCEAGLVELEALGAATAETVAPHLETAGARDPMSPATRLVRSARSLAENHRGSLEALARGCTTLEELGEHLARLSPGIGSGTVVRFLRPLRDLWSAAREIPLTPAARAAAIHLGWIGESEDQEGEPGALRAFLAREAQAPRLRDVEAALERLGRAACLRERPDRCPLEAACPLRG